MMLTLADDRPAHLTRVHQALTALPEADRVRLGVTEDWKTGPHQLTYRQVEHTFSLVADALSKDEPDGAPSDDLAGVCDDLLEASIPAGHKDAIRCAGRGLDRRGDLVPAAPARHHRCADPEAHWGHRNS